MCTVCEQLLIKSENWHLMTLDWNDKKGHLVTNQRNCWQTSWVGSIIRSGCSAGAPPEHSMHRRSTTGSTLAIGFQCKIECGVDEPVHRMLRRSIRTIIIELTRYFKHGIDSTPLISCCWVPNNIISAGFKQLYPRYWSNYHEKCWKAVP